MNRLILCLAFASAASYASATGFLIHSEMVTTVTYQQAWRCTYSVNGQTVSIVLASYCPGTYQFN